MDESTRATGAPMWRHRAAAILIAGVDVLLQRKDGDSEWAVPGGGIEFGESAQAAFAREMEEELSWRPADARLICVLENYFKLGRRSVQQYGFYFLADATALRARHGHIAAGVDFRCADPSLTFRWQTVSRLAEVDLRPRPVAELIQRPPQHVVHLANGFS